MTRTALLAGSLVAALAAGVAHAQTPIGSLDATGGITISGTVSDVFGNKFVLEDESGRVLVENGPDWFHRIEVARGEKVSVTGRPEGGSFDAFTIVRADGTRVEVRPAGGPPPWAGGRERHAERGGRPDRRDGERSGQRQRGEERGPRRVAAAEELPRDQIMSRLEAAGYTDIDDVDRKGRHWEVDARNRFGDKVEVHIDFAGNIYKEERD